MRVRVQNVLCVNGKLMRLAGIKYIYAYIHMLQHPHTHTHTHTRTHTYTHAKFT